MLPHDLLRALHNIFNIYRVREQDTVRGQDWDTDGRTAGALHSESKLYEYLYVSRSAVFEGNRERFELDANAIGATRAQSDARRRHLHRLQGSASVSESEPSVRTGQSTVTLHQGFIQGGCVGGKPPIIWEKS